MQEAAATAAAATTVVVVVAHCHELSGGAAGAARAAVVGWRAMGAPPGGMKTQHRGGEGGRFGLHKGGFDTQHARRHARGHRQRRQKEPASEAVSADAPSRPGRHEANDRHGGRRGYCWCCGCFQRRCRPSQGAAPIQTLAEDDHARTHARALAAAKAVQRHQRRPVASSCVLFVIIIFVVVVVVFRHCRPTTGMPGSVGRRGREAPKAASWPHGVQRFTRSRACGRWRRGWARSRWRAPARCGTARAGRRR